MTPTTTGAARRPILQGPRPAVSALCGAGPGTSVPGSSACRSASGSIPRSGSTSTGFVASKKQAHPDTFPFSIAILGASIYPRAGLRASDGASGSNASLRARARTRRGQCFHGTVGVILRVPSRPPLLVSGDPSSPDEDACYVFGSAPRRFRLTAGNVHHDELSALKNKESLLIEPADHLGVRQAERHFGNIGEHYNLHSRQVLECRADAGQFLDIRFSLVRQPDLLLRPGGSAHGVRHLAGVWREERVRRHEAHVVIVVVITRPLIEERGLPAALDDIGDIIAFVFPATAAGIGDRRNVEVTSLGGIEKEFDRVRHLPGRPPAVREAIEIGLLILRLDLALDPAGEEEEVGNAGVRRPDRNLRAGFLTGPGIAFAFSQGEAHNGIEVFALQVRRPGSELARARDIAFAAGGLRHAVFEPVDARTVVAEVDHGRGPGFDGPSVIPGACIL